VGGRPAAIGRLTPPTESTRVPDPATCVVADSLSLAVAWSRDQPELVGLVAAVEGARVLGRGNEQPDDRRHESP
jgi:hypothetical protein